MLHEAQAMDTMIFEQLVKDGLLEGSHCLLTIQKATAHCRIKCLSSCTTSCACGHDLSGMF